MSEDQADKSGTGRNRRAWFALAWAVGFAILYARSVVIDRFPALAAWFRGL